jgi:hypothetical protein
VKCRKSNHLGETGIVGALQALRVGLNVSINPCIKHTCVILDTRRLFHELIDAEFEGVEESHTEVFVAEAHVDYL